MEHLSGKQVVLELSLDSHPPHLLLKNKMSDENAHKTSPENSHVNSDENCQKIVWDPNIRKQYDRTPLCPLSFMLFYCVHVSA